MAPFWTCARPLPSVRKVPILLGNALLPVPMPRTRPIPPGLSLHLVSDLDGTWIPAPERSAGLRRLEAFLDSQPGIVLTFATGRGLASALALLGQRVRRLPRHLVTDVGTALHHRTADGRWREDPDYARWVETRWPAGLERCLALAGYPEGVRPQPDVTPGRRLALEVAPGADLIQSAARLRSTLAGLGLPVDVLPSHGRLLDVLPRGVDKAAAVRHLGLPLPVVACGDSENDLSLWGIADLPVLMADSAIPRSLAQAPWERLIRPSAPGPEGILEVLQGLLEPEERA